MPITDDITLFKLIQEPQWIKTYREEYIAIPKLETKLQRLNALKDWCYRLGAEGFDIELTLKSLNKNRHLFKYRSSAIWTLWLYCNYIPRERVEMEFVWAHYLFNNMCRLEEPTEALVWLELMSHSNRVPAPLPRDIYKLIESGILVKVDLTGSLNFTKDSITTYRWAISNTEDVLNSLNKRKLTKYLVEGIGTTWGNS